MTEQQEKNIRRAIELLKSGKYTQIRGAYTQKISGKTCYSAVGLMINKISHSVGIQAFRDAFGLPRGAMAYLIRKNDSGASFEQIADYLEKFLVGRK